MITPLLLLLLILHILNNNALLPTRNSLLKYKIINNNIQRKNNKLHTLYVSKISSEINNIRNSLAEDERTSLMMDALRGKNMNDDDKQGDGIEMKIVEFDSSGDSKNKIQLPTIYDPVLLEAYFNKRPKAVLTRIWQVLSVSIGFWLGVGVDILTGNTEDIEVRRAVELRSTIVSLGPFFIKLGQALSIRPDILSPRAMVELQQLCDKVPCFDSGLAMETLCKELNINHPSDVYSKITPEPVAAASLGQVYRATLKDTNEEVAVKVQRPFVLETVSLDLYLGRQLGLLLRKFPAISNRLDIVSLLDEFAGNFYQELDYNLECENGIKVAEDMKKLKNVLIPRNYPQYTSRRVHTAQWVEGEKLSQSTADDVSALVNLGVITYLTQLLDTGFFHADPHPGNMLRAPDGRLVILDFGLMTRITDDQKYGMIEAIAHLIHRDYDRIGDDFVNLGFIPPGVDTAPIVPALARVFEAALAGGGAKSINFQELAADLAEITFKFPFRIPPYFALIIRAISVLEGIALVGNPEFAIVDEAYPYISKRLMTDETPRLREAFRYMVYGKGDSIDVDRLIDMLQALEKFVAVKERGDGSAFKVDGVRAGKYVGKGGDALGTKAVEAPVLVSSSALSSVAPSAISAARGAGAAAIASSSINPLARDGSEGGSGGLQMSDSAVRESLRFFFSDEGALFREFVLDEAVNGLDALSRDALRELVFRLGVPKKNIPLIFQAAAPRLSTQDRQAVDGLVRLVSFLVNGSSDSESVDRNAEDVVENTRRESRRQRNSRNAPVTPVERPVRESSSEIIRSLRPPSPQEVPFIVGRLILSAAGRRVGRRATSSSNSLGRLSSLTPILREFSPNVREFGFQLLQKMTKRSTERLVEASLDAIFGPEPSSEAPKQRYMYQVSSKQ